MSKARHKRMILNRIYEELFHRSPIDNRKIASLIINHEEHHLHSLLKNPNYQYSRDFTNAVEERAKLLVYAYNIEKEQKDQLTVADILDLLEDYEDRKAVENG